MRAELLIGALEAPPPGIEWLAVIPFSVTIGKWLGDLLDLCLNPPAEGIDWAKLGGVGGGLFGVTLYLTHMIAAGSLVFF